MSSRCFPFRSRKTTWSLICEADQRGVVTAWLACCTAQFRRTGRRTAWKRPSRSGPRHNSTSDAPRSNVFQMTAAIVSALMDHPAPSGTPDVLKLRLGGQAQNNVSYPADEVSVYRATTDQRRAIGTHTGSKFVITHAPPKAISPAQTICGSIAISAEMSPTIAPSTDCIALSRSFAIL